MTRSRGAKWKWMTGTSDLPGGWRTRQRRLSITRRGRGGVVMRVFAFLLGLAFEEDLKKDFRSYLAPYTVSSWKVGLALDNTKRATEWTTCSELRRGERVARDIATYDSIIWGRNNSLPFSRDVGCLCGNLSLSNAIRVAIRGQLSLRAFSRPRSSKLGSIGSETWSFALSALGTKESRVMSALTSPKYRCGTRRVPHPTAQAVTLQNTRLFGVQA